VENEVGGLDVVDWGIVEALQANARISFSELGRQIGLSASALTERIRRLEGRGIIEGYHARINRAKLGMGITVHIHLRPLATAESALLSAVMHLPEVCVCRRLTGNDCYFLEATVTSIPHLEQLLRRLTPFGQITTSVILSTPIAHRPLSRHAYPTEEFEG
jgi:Lrp/AsnC family transcriptional regulator, leucine-responsive regulatory protein